MGDLANEALWLTRARAVAKAVVRAEHPGMSDAEFEKTWAISTDDWRWRYLNGVKRGFVQAGLNTEDRASCIPANDAEMPSRGWT